MYVESLSISHFKCFERADVTFQYPGRRHGSKQGPRINNVNLLLGDNATGKTTVLRAIAISVLGEIMQRTGYRPWFLVRRNSQSEGPLTTDSANVHVCVRVHSEDRFPPQPNWWGTNPKVGDGRLDAEVTISRKGDIESVAADRGTTWDGLYDDKYPAFFIAGYGTNRRVASTESYDNGARLRDRGPRYQRVAGMFEEYIALTPPAVWAAALDAKDRLDSGINIINSLMMPGNVRLGRRVPPISEVLFLIQDTAIPFTELSDGFKGFISWVGDLLYQINAVTPQQAKLTDIHGVVMIDEVDLLLHPEWQRTVVDSLASAFPNLQFFFTSHSPLVAGTLESTNILLVEHDAETGLSSVQPGKENIHGLSPDQVLSGAYFGLSTPRSPDAVDQMKDLADRATKGDAAASIEFLKRLTEGFPPGPEVVSAKPSRTNSK